MSNHTDRLNGSIVRFLDRNVEIRILRAHSMVSELQGVRENGIEIRHPAVTRLSARVHQHVANDVIGALAVFLYFRDILLEVVEHLLNVFRLLRFHSFALLREGLTKFVHESH